MIEDIEVDDLDAELYVDELRRQEVKNRMVGIKITKTEEARLEEVCLNLGVTKSRYMRYLMVKDLATRL